MRRIRVMLADDQLLFVQNLKLVLETQSDDIEVTAIAHNGREAVELSARDAPDVILMDVRMPELDGVEATRLIHESHPGIKIIVLTAFDDDDDYVHRALRYGASGYLLKNIPTEELLAALDAVTAGAFVIFPEIARKLVQEKGDRTQGAGGEPPSPAWLLQLGNRERDVLRLMGRGYTNRRIADALYISEPTVKNYVSAIYAKLGTRDRYEVMNMARSLEREHPEDARS